MNCFLASPKPDLLTDDPIAVLRYAADAVAAGISTALLTLTEIRGGASRRLGSQMAVLADGRYCGFISGGCIEAAAATEAMQAIAAGSDRTLSYGDESPFFDLVLPCGGGITVGVHILQSSQPLHEALSLLGARKTAGLRYDSVTRALACIPHPCETGWRGRHFHVGFQLRTRLIIYGRSIDADTTAILGRSVGYDVHLSDASTSRAPSLIDEHSAVVLLFHDLDQEIGALKTALSAKPFYIGALGSSRTHQRRVEALRSLGYSTHEIARIKAPIGLFPKARDARSLALSILADIAALSTAEQKA